METVKSDKFSLDEILILVDAIAEWSAYLKSVDQTRKDTDPKLLQENKDKAKELSVKLWTIKCQLEDQEIAKSKA